MGRVVSSPLFGGGNGMVGGIAPPPGGAGYVVVMAVAMAVVVLVLVAVMTAAVTTAAISMQILAMPTRSESILDHIAVYPRFFKPRVWREFFWWQRHWQT